jgi:dipeptidyl aminopeptidase/acylaminoacyl peptidase
MPQPLMPIEEIRQSAWIGDAFCNGRPRSIIVNFHGLGFNGLKQGPAYDEAEWGAAGALIVYPYYGPWSWMNRAARTFVDRLIDSVKKHFELNESAPLIIAGGSMGGQGALIYTRYSPHRITACFANFPVCDLAYHFTERPDLPATMRQAFREQPNFDAAIEECSPLKQVSGMPNIPYLITHGDKDLAVNKEKHSDRLVAEMRKLGKNIEYLEVPGMGHGINTPYHATRKHLDWVKKFFS